MQAAANPQPPGEQSLGDLFRINGVGETGESRPIADVRLPASQLPHKEVIEGFCLSR